MTDKHILQGINNEAGSKTNKEDAKLLNLEQDMLEQDMVEQGMYEQDMYQNREELQQKRFEHTTKLRRVLTTWALIVVSVWLVVVLLILFLNIYFTSVLHLSDKVIITLLATTTANVLGLTFIILKGLFK